MSVNEIVQMLNISHNTFNDWSQKGHSKYELSLLLQGLTLKLDDTTTQISA